MKNTFRHIVVIAACAAAFPMNAAPVISRADYDNRAQDIWMSGFGKLESAANAEKPPNKAQIEALKLYYDALKDFQTVSLEYPDWRPEVISYRIRFCETKIRNLNLAIGKDPSKLSDADRRALVDIMTGDMNKMSAELKALSEAKLKTELALSAQEREMQGLRKKANAANNALQKIAAAEAAVGTLTTERDALKEQLAQATKEAADAQAKMEIAVKEAAELKVKLAGINKGLDEKLTQAEAEKAAAIAKAEAGNKDLVKKIADLKKQAAALEDETKELTKAKAAAEGGKASLEKQLTETRADLERAQKNAGSAGQESTKLNAQIAELKKTIGARDATIATNAKSIKAMEAQIADTRTEQEKAQKSIVELTADLKARTTEIAGLAQAKTAIEQQLADTKTELAKANQAVADSKLSATTQVKTLQDKVAALEASLKTTTDSNAANAQAKVSLEKQLADTKAELTQANQAVADSKLSATTQVKTLQDKVTALEASLKTTTDSNTANAQAKASLEKQLADTKTELAKANQAVADSKLSATTQVKTLQEKVTTLEAGLKSKTAEAITLAEAKATLEKQLDEISRKLAGDTAVAAARIKALQEQETTLSAQLKTEKAGTAALTEAKAALEKQLTEIKADLGKAQQLANANQNNSANQIRELTAKATTLDSQLKAKTMEAEGLAKTKTGLEKDLGKIQQDLQTLQPQLEASRNEIKQNTLAIQALTKERDDLRSQLAKEQKNSTDTAAAAAILQAKLNEKNNLAGQLQTSLDKQLKTNADLNEQLKKLNALNYEALEKQLREAELKIKKIDQEMTLTKQDLIAKTEAESTLIRREQEYLRAAKEKAEAEYKKQLQEHERQARIHDRLAAASNAEKDRNYTVALEQLGLVLQDDPNNKLALERIGLVHVARGDDAKAEEWLGRAFDSNSSNPNILVPLALAQIRQSKPQLALATTARAVALDPKNGEYQRYLGLACNELGWVDAAETSLTKALEITPNDVETAYTLATILAARASDDTGVYTAENYKARAQKWYEKALQLGRKKDADLDAFFAEK